ncbi:MAG TPA: hypothetical protein VNU26_04840 [Mycobacteriales bacterium]|nr:hypothetical protein [Mycobacteriales bacterium]
MTRAFVLCAAAAAASAVALAVVQPVAAATSFQAVAAATTVSAQVSNPDQLPLGATVETSGPTSQATVDQLGTSKAFASHPYPGDFAVGAPGLANGAGSPVPVPDYPFYVTSDVQNTPEARAEGPGYSLSATSSERASTGDAVGGVTGDLTSGRSRATSTTTAAEDGRITATASSAVDSVVVDGVLRFTSVRSTVTVVRGTDGKTTRTSSLEADGVSVAGQRVGLVDGELVIAGTKIPLEGTPLGDVLDDAGIAVSQTAAQDTPEGRTGGALQVTVVDARPETGSTRTTYRLGGVSAFVSAAAGAEPAVADVEVAEPPTATFDLPDTPAASISTGDLQADAAPLTSDALASVEAPLAASEEAQKPRRLVSYLPERSDAVWLYLPFVVAAAALCGCTQVLRHLGVKARL